MLMLLISFSQYQSLEIILPRYLNYVTCSTRCPSTRIFNSWFPVCDIHITLVFVTLIFIPYFFVMGTLFKLSIRFCSSF